jgi:hypothetical protein
MSNFEKWNDRYKRGWVTKSQLQRLVLLQVLTQNEYDEIVGSD